MFFQGKIYPVCKASNSIQVAFRRLLEHQADMFLLLHAAETVESVQFLVDQLIPGFEEPVTEANKLEILQAIRLHQQDSAMAQIVEVKNHRAWKRAHCAKMPLEESEHVS